MKDLDDYAILARERPKLKQKAGVGRDYQVVHDVVDNE